MILLWKIDSVLYFTCARNKTIFKQFQILEIACLSLYNSHRWHQVRESDSQTLQHDRNISYLDTGNLYFPSTWIWSIKYITSIWQMWYASDAITWNIGFNQSTDSFDNWRCDARYKALMDPERSQNPVKLMSTIYRMKKQKTHSAFLAAGEAGVGSGLGCFLSLGGCSLKCWSLSWKYCSKARGKKKGMRKPNRLRE